METIVAILVAIGIFLSGVSIGVKTSKEGFSCTESAVVEGSATCVKYERDGT